MRVDYVVRCPDGIRQREPVSVIEARITEVTRSWGDELRVALISKLGEGDGVELYRRFGDAFPAGYRADCEAPMAIADIARIDRAATHRQAGDRRLPPRRRGAGGWSAAGCCRPRACRCRMSCRSSSTWARPSVDERPYEITPDGADPVWVYDFGLRCDPDGLQRAGDEFARTFLGVWLGDLEDDRLNALVMLAGLSGRQITIIRAVLRYLRQAAIAFSDAYMITDAARQPADRGAAGRAVRGPVRPRRPRRAADRDARARDHRGDRQRRQPRRGPDPAQPAGGAAARCCAPTTTAAPPTASRSAICRSSSTRRS